MNLNASTVLQEIKCAGSVALVSQSVERERNFEKNLKLINYWIMQHFPKTLWHTIDCTNFYLIWKIKYIWYFQLSYAAICLIFSDMYYVLFTPSYTFLAINQQNNCCKYHLINICIVYIIQNRLQVKERKLGLKRVIVQQWYLLRINFDSFEKL